MSKTPIYLDYAATTPIDPEVAEAMKSALDLEQGLFGNPASLTHHFGKAAKKLVEHARTEVAELIHALPHEIIFTSGATESNNLAIKGAAFANQKKGRHLITMMTEHKSVLESFQYLESKGFSVTYLRPNQHGLLSETDLMQAIKPDTILLSIMHVNNETGVIQPIETIANICAQHKILLHVDAAQSVGKIAIDLQKTPIDLLSLASHKVYGPKGIGALFIKTQAKKTRVEIQTHGGGHEFGYRSGTLATHQIIGMGKAFALAHAMQENEFIKFKKMREMILKGLIDIPGIIFNAETQYCVPGIVNFTIQNIDAISLIHAMPELALSMGSACNAASIQPSHVLSAMGISDELAASTLRLSFGRFTTENEIMQTVKTIKDAAAWLRKLSPYEVAYV